MQRRTVKYLTPDDIVRDAQSLLESGYLRVGNWSLGQNCNHLAQTMEYSRDGFPSQLPAPLRSIMRLLFMGRMQRRLPTRMRFPTLPSLQQSAPVDDERAIDRLAKAVGRIIEPGATFVASPVFGRTTPEQWLQFHLWHAEHHLSFLLPKSVVEDLSLSDSTVAAGAPA